MWTDRQIWPALYAFISCTSCKERILQICKHTCNTFNVTLNKTCLISWLNYFQQKYLKYCNRERKALECFKKMKNMAGSNIKKPQDLCWKRLLFNEACTCIMCITTWTWELYGPLLAFTSNWIMHLFRRKLCASSSHSISVNFLNSWFVYKYFPKCIGYIVSNGKMVMNYKFGWSWKVVNMVYEW
jgi:hypothetical protein